MKSIKILIRKIFIYILSVKLKAVKTVIGVNNFDKISFYLFLKYWSAIATKQMMGREQKQKPRLIWCPINMINHKYWASAMQELGYKTTTVSDGVNFIAGYNDFDLFTCIEGDKNLFNHILNKWSAILYDLRGILPNIVHYLAFDFLLKNFDIVHCSFLGTFLWQTPFWKHEAFLFKQFGIKVIIQPYGADMYMMSQIIDPLLRHTYISHSPQMAIDESKISKKVKYWTENADALLPNLAIDGMGRWSALPYNTLAIDINLWHAKKHYSQNDGRNGEVKVIHTPNHRYLKGTEYLVEAINELRDEGLSIKLILLEKKPNSEVRRLMQEEADILAEQFVFNAYAMSGVEGMASGIAVMANLSERQYTRAFRLHSFLNECPVLSTPIEEIKENLKLLVTNPQLREQLGRAGRQYVEKYHSYKAAQYMFEKVYDKIWYNKNVDLMNMYHPLNPESYNNQSPKIQHPLVNGQYLA